MYIKEMINAGTTRYALQNLPDTEDARGFYYPDAVIEPYVSANRKDPPSVPPPPENQPRFTLDEAKNLITEAFHAYSPALGKKAEDLLATATYNPRPQGDYFDPAYELDIEDGSRWNIHHAEPENARLMRSLPALSDKNELGPENPHPHAIIEFEFDGTMNSVVYMAHEMGHSIADDQIKKPDGYRYGDNRPTAHILETQAYLPQMILYDYLERHPDKNISDFARHHRLSTIEDNVGILLAADKAVSDNHPDKEKLLERMHGRPMALLTAATIHDAVKDQPVERRDFTLDFLHGKYGHQGITHVLAATGIENTSNLTAAIANPGPKPDGTAQPVPRLNADS